MVIFFSIPRSEWPGGHYLDQIPINAGGRDAATIQVIPWAIIEVRSGSLVRYCTHKEIISGRPEQVYLPSDQAWNDLVRGHYFSRTRINAWTKIRLLFKLSNGQLLKSGLGPLARYGTHQETISGRPEQKYLLSEQRLECPAEGPLFKPVCFCKFQIAYPDR